jgi:predicted DNA-binding transcriptional regulator AlpA
MKSTFKTNDDLPATLSANDISKYLGISRANSYQLMDSTGFPTLRIGKRKLVPKDKFLNWVNNSSNTMI